MSYIYDFAIYMRFCRGLGLWENKFISYQKHFAASLEV